MKTYVESTGSFMPPCYATDDDYLANWKRLDPLIQETIRSFAVYRDDYFEKGMTSRFMRELSRLYELYKNIKIGSYIFKILHYCVNSTSISHYDIAGEALSWVAHMVPDDEFVDVRLWLLTDTLISNDDLRIRDAASCGIDSMGDPRAIRAVEHSLEKETHDWQHNWLQRVLDGLKEIERKQNERMGQISNSTS